MVKNKDMAEKWSSDEVINIARWKKYFIWIALLQILEIAWFTIQMHIFKRSPSGGHQITGYWVIIFPYIIILNYAISILFAYVMYNFSVSLKKSAPVLYALSAIIGFVNLIVLFVLNDEATKILRSNGIRANFFGVHKARIT